MASTETKAQAAGMVKAVRDFVQRAMAKNNVDFEKRLKALESRPVLSYRGVWKADQDYLAGNLVTHSGSMFHCHKQTREKPGESDAWQLCVKRGADGKDTR